MACPTTNRVEALKAMTQDDLKARAAELLTRHGLIVAAVGDIDAAELGRQPRPDLRCAADG
ncbi:MAG: hypothetical protein WDN31_19380 [Hyphomicrobium sp.]